MDILKYCLNQKEHGFFKEIEAKFPKIEQWINELLAHFQLTSMAEVLGMLKELKSGKADKDKFGLLEKKVQDMSKQIEEMLNMINFLQRSGDKSEKIEYKPMPVSSGVDSEALNALKAEIENLKRQMKELEK